MNRQIPICRAGLEEGHSPLVKIFRLDALYGSNANPRAFWANGFQGVKPCRILEENNGRYSLRASPYSRWRFALLCPRQRLAEQSTRVSLKASFQIHFRLIITEAENPRLARVFSLFTFKKSHKSRHHKATINPPSRVCYCSIPCLFNQEVLQLCFMMKNHYA